MEGPTIEGVTTINKVPREKKKKRENELEK